MKRCTRAPVPRPLRRWALAPAVAALILFSAAGFGQAQGPTQLPPTQITAPRPSAEPAPEPPEPPEPPAPLRPFFAPGEPGRTDPVGNGLLAPPSASAGFFTQAEIMNFPMVRTTEFLELVPGLIVSQHSGTVKANSYFLRGFALDNGTDFAGFVDDVPYNLPSNPHSQGYLDLNSVIPELIERVDFRKGPYYTDVGDFSTVGTVNIHYVDELPFGFWRMEAGKWDWFRTVVASSGHVGQGVLLYGIEDTYYNGPYQSRENAGRLSAVFKYSMGDSCDGLRLSAYLYNASGNLNNQIPLRAVHQGLISSLGNEDPSDFLTTQRYTLNGQWWHRSDGGALTQANVYAYYYSLNIFSNFTFFLEDPVHGDQIDQLDRRWVTGLNLAHTWDSALVGHCLQHSVGLQIRNDSLPHVGLHHTENRELVNVISDDTVDQFSVGVYGQSQIKWTEKARTVLGLRGDFYTFDVQDPYIPENSGTRNSSLPSPKGSLILGPWNRTNFYLNGGYSFHSNDARGVLAVLNPSFTGEEPAVPTRAAPGLARSRGCEVGCRSQAIPGLTTGAALWQLHLQQELIFEGDEGATVPRRSSDRYGIEWTNTYEVCPWLYLNADYAWSHGRLLGPGDPDAPGNHIPDAITTTFSGGPMIQLPSGWFAELRFRYWGPRALIEDNSASSRATQTFDASMGYQNKRLSAGLELLNLFNSNGHDIDFFYTSALKTDPNFPDGVADIHFRQLEPFAARFYLTLRW